MQHRVLFPIILLPLTVINTHTHTHTQPSIFVNENIAFIKWVMHFVNWIQAYSLC